ncbi:MAG TPA: glycosyltransferase family 9 protein [Acidimicrobiales bacterium]|nr:glycosyltransferase family 9 protein [Acidimicrobiales bacterium]
MLTGGRRVLMARTDNLGDVLLTGPAVRAVAASGAEVHYLCSPQGRPAAEALPGVKSVIDAAIPWIDADPPAAGRAAMERLTDRLAETEAEEAIILTSFHQSPLPLALLMRMAGVARISAISVDYPGSLLDLRHRVEDDIHEVERALSLVAAAGFELPDDDDRRLHIRLDPPLGAPSMPPVGGGPGYVVVHAGASVPARAWAPGRHAELIAALTALGRRVVLTGGRGEKPLTAHLTTRASQPGSVVDLAGRTDFPTLARVISGADALVCGNTGPAHLAAATGTPVVSIFAPTVPAVRWRPWMTPHVILGRQDIGCAGCRARECPVPGHPCISQIPVESVIGAVEKIGRSWPAPASRLPASAQAVLS